MRAVLLHTVFLLLYIKACSQEIDIRPFIKAWQTTDLSQTHRSVVFYDRLDLEKDSLKHSRTLAALYNYLKKNDDPRIRARTLMYEAFGAMVFGYNDKKYTSLLEKAMQIARELKDDQLLAEIYPLYAEIASQNNHLLYNLKAIEMQQRIGFEHFNTIHNRFFIISNALYHSRDYRQSIQYGLKCLRFVTVDREHWLKKVYILQLDILGASYKKLGLYDSTVYYYQKILDTLAINPDTGFMQKLWTGIAKGNIGHCLSLKNNDAAGIPLIKEYIKNSSETGDQANIVIGSAMLAATYYRQHQTNLALQNWQQAFFYSDKKNPTDHLLESTKGIADIYKSTGKTDSAFYYYDLYHVYSDTLDSRLNESTLAAMNAHIAFDNLEDYLDKSQLALSQSRTVLQAIIAGIFLLAVILALFYSRYRLKSKHKLELIQRKKELAEQEIENAKKQIAQFTDHIIQKNNIIDSMQNQLRENKEHLENEVTLEKLSRYILISEEEWEKFRIEFSKAYPQFFNQLRKRLPHINPAEERLSALIYLKINNYQMANMLGIERDSVFRAKRRLRQRLELPDSQTLEDYLHNILEINY